MRKNISIIDKVADNCADRIVETVLNLSEFYAGSPGLVTEFNREVFNKLTPASEVILEAEYGPEFVALWKQKMGLGSGGANV